MYGYSSKLFILICALEITCGERSKWLMIGEILSEEEIRTRHLDVTTTEHRHPISTVTDIFFKMDNHRKIQGVIVASITLNGYVSVVYGGLDQEEMIVSYVTENGHQDTLFILIQSGNYKKDLKTNNSRVQLNDSENSK